MTTEYKPNWFKPGNPGGPGRRKGSRAKLSESFVQVLYNDFQEHGAEVIERVRANSPEQYIKVIASILPREIKVETNTDLTDEQLNERIRQLADLFEIGVVGASDGSETSEGSAQVN